MGKKFANVFKYVFLSILSLVSIFPFYWMVMAATNQSVDVTKGTLIPGSYFLQNLQAVLDSDLLYLNSYGNSIIITMVTTVLAMIVSSAAGYAFVVYKTKGRERIFDFIFASMMVPFAALMVPLFKLFSNFNKLGLGFIGLNSPGAVIITGIATAFLIFFFKQNTATFPKDLIEAARIDGLGEIKIFLKIYMPTMKSTYAAAIVVTFMNVWNSYLWPLIALQSGDKRTLPLILSAMGASYTPDYGMMMCAVVLATIPTAAIFFLMQKQFVAGMTGAVKG